MPLYHLLVPSAKGFIIILFIWANMGKQSLFLFEMVYVISMIIECLHFSVFIIVYLNNILSFGVALVAARSLVATL